MGPVRQNPIQRTVRSVHVCALHCAQLLHTILHRTDLIIFPPTLQTITIAPVMSIWGKGDSFLHLKPVVLEKNIRRQVSDAFRHTECECTKRKSTVSSMCLKYSCITSSIQPAENKTSVSIKNLTTEFSKLVRHLQIEWQTEFCSAFQTIESARQNAHSTILVHFTLNCHKFSIACIHRFS